MHEYRQPPTEARLALPLGHAAFVIVLACVVGLLVGLTLPWLAGLLQESSWAPFRVPAELVGLLDSMLPGWVLPGAALTIGLAGGVAAVHQAPVVSVSERDIVVTKGTERIRIARSQAAEVVVNGHRLVVLDQADIELLREDVEGGADRLAEALQRYGWLTATETATHRTGDLR